MSEIIESLGMSLEETKNCMANIDTALAKEEVNLKEIGRNVVKALKAIALIEGIYWCLVESEIDEDE